MVLTSDAFLIGMLGVLAAFTAKLGVVAMFNLYFVPCVSSDSAKQTCMHEELPVVAANHSNELLVVL